MSVDRIDPADIYTERRRHFAGEWERYSRSWNRLGNARLLVALILVLCAFWGLRWRAPSLAIGAGAAVCAFAAIARRQRQLGELRGHAAALVRVNAEGEARLARDWDALPLRPISGADPQHPYAADLDLFGRGSLWHLLDSGASHTGGATLRGWLLHAATPETARARQAAVAELAPLLDFRQALAVYGEEQRTAGDAMAPLFSWAEGDRWLAGRGRLVWVARLSPLLLWPFLMAWLVWPLVLVGLVSYPGWLATMLSPPFSFAFLILLVGQFVLSQRSAGAVQRVLAQPALRGRPFAGYAELCRLVSSHPLTTPRLVGLCAALGEGQQRADRRMRQFHALCGFIALRNLPAYPLFQILTLADVHLLAALEYWQTRAGTSVRGWIAAVSEVEALSALAGLRHDNPGWAFPLLDPAAGEIAARDLGHPLIADDRRVANDVRLGPAGTFLLVTGSNMAGKSTLLRALGVNLVLAGAGGVVCATDLRLPAVSLWTSMRITDSLDQGVSYFFAELQRLKSIVQAARESGAPDSPKLCYLLDEILQGTNTVERQLAARRVIGYLIRLGAIGAVSTHDLTLACSPDLTEAARAVHFTEILEAGPDGPSLSFDYRMRPGIATTTNALRLLEALGLPTAEA